MGVFLEIEYGGQTVASVPIEITESGYVIKASLSADESPLAQLGHIWLNGHGNVGRGVASVNSEVEQTLRILLRAETTTDLAQFQDFIQLRTAIALWLKSDEVLDTGLKFSFAAFEVPTTGLLISKAELEVPEQIYLLISKAELEVALMSVFISQAELQVPLMSVYISQAEFEVPDV